MSWNELELPVKILKIIGILALGAGVLVVGGIVLGLITSLIHVAIPVAIVFGLGWLAYKVFFESHGPQEKQEEKKDGEKKLEAKPEVAALPKQAMTEAQALAAFEEHRKKLGPP